MSVARVPGTYREGLPKLEPGDRVLFVVPGIPEDAAPELREALSIRNTANLTGTCPCGAERSFAGYDHRELAHASIRHEHDCPASNENLRPLLREHVAAGRSKLQDVVLEGTVP